MDRKALKEEKKRKKLEKFASKQPEVTKPKKNPPKAHGYDPSLCESKWVQYWEKNELFLPQPSASKFVIPMPPPNVTGVLHIGHAMMIAIQDCIARYKRMTGYEVLYIPGTDHAGIATQSVVLKKLYKERSDSCYEGNGKSVNEMSKTLKTSENSINMECESEICSKPLDVGREEFMQAAWKWKNEHGNKIYEQFKKLGTSADFSRARFTMDEGMCEAVNEAFVRLYDKGLIYRANKVINWCGKLQTTISDLEVNHENIEPGTFLEVDNGKYEFGVLYCFKYPILAEKHVNVMCEKNGEVGDQNDCFMILKKSVKLNELPYVEVSTTRPETILGDTALCINPEDARFKKEGIRRLLQLCSNSDQTLFYAVNPLTREVVPVVRDALADINFGTGVLKITPAHDPDDFELSLRHNLQVKSIMDNDNYITHPLYKGIKRFEAKKLIIERLKELGLFVKKLPHNQVIPRCSRSNDIIEPRIKAQWWLNCKKMAKEAIEVVKRNELFILPLEASKHWYRWLENIRDWCISRQLMWGHRVPAYRSEYGWVVARNKEEALEKVLKMREMQISDGKEIKSTEAELNSQLGDRGDGTLAIEAKLKNVNLTSEIALDPSSVTCKIEQDEDVLDTWFSSGLWPFSILGWPNQTKDYFRYYPTSILETGSDILFFWVARMVMLGLELTGKLPFNTVLLHGIVRDAHGRKMSKSLGNVIDPIHVIEGCDLKTLVSNMKMGNLSDREMKKAEEGLKKDFPKGIPKCGADALRFALLSYNNGMKDINLDILRVEGYRRLCNKLWNAYKFVEIMIGTEKSGVAPSSTPVIFMSYAALDIGNLPDFIKWIIDRRNRTIGTVEKALDTYNFMSATQAVHQFFLYDFCDIYIEITKVFRTTESLSVLYLVFNDILKIAHPFMPFITEEIYSRLVASYDGVDTENTLKPKNTSDVVDIDRGHVKSVMLEKFPKTVEMSYDGTFDDLLKDCSIIRSKVENLKCDKARVVVNDMSMLKYVKVLCKKVVSVTLDKDHEICVYADE